MSDPYFNKRVKLLLHCDGSNGGTTFTDSSPLGHTVTPTNFTTSTAWKLFGTASALSGSVDDNNLLVASHADFEIGYANFTVEFTFRQTDQTGLQGIFNIGQYHNGLLIRVTATTLVVYVVNQLYTFSYTFSANTTYQIAVCRKDLYVYAFVNGAQVGTEQLLGGYIPALDIKIGVSAHSWAEYFRGYLDEIRLTVGVARYVDNYTVDTSAFSDTQTIVAGNLSEALDIADWRVTAVECATGDSVSTSVSTGATYSIDVETLEPVNITLSPKIDKAWQTGLTPSVGDFWVPSDFEATPHLFECTTSGAVGGTEPSWNLSGTTSDGSAVWTYVAPLVDPVTIGPKLPT